MPEKEQDSDFNSERLDSFASLCVLCGFARDDFIFLQSSVIIEKVSAALKNILQGSYSD
jgi:hypothetical protein